MISAVLLRRSRLRTHQGGGHGRRGEESSTHDALLKTDPDKSRARLNGT
jgi:hypothetical protein